MAIIVYHLQYHTEYYQFVYEWVVLAEYHVLVTAILWA
jgi:hypothetical protein